MAGEVEGQLNLADCLHSGSISFGRFESDLLSWQRRSSFGYNRYLDDVERYSTPGLVTQKKAYFEAQFRRRALLRQTSSYHQSSPESQEAGGGETKTESTGYLSFNSEEKDFALPEKKLVLNGPLLDDEKFFGSCQIPISLDGHECKEEGKHHHKIFTDGLSSSNLADHDECRFSPGETLVPKEKCSDISIKQSPNLENPTLEKILGKRNSSVKSSSGGKDSAPNQKKTQKANLMVKAAVEHNYSKGKPASPKVSRSLYNKESVTSSTTSPKTFRRAENTMLPGNIDKASSLSPPPAMYSKSRNLRSEGTEKRKANLREDMQRSSSNKDLRPAKDVGFLSALTKKPAKGASTSKVDTKQNFARRGLTMPEKRKEAIRSQIKSPRLQSKGEGLVNMISHETSPGSSKVSSRSTPSSQLLTPTRLDRPTATNGVASREDLSVKTGNVAILKGNNTPTANPDKISDAKKDLRYKPKTPPVHRPVEVKKVEMVSRTKGRDAVTTVRRGRAQKVIGLAGGFMPVSVAS